MSRILLINPGHDDEHENYKHKTHRRIHRDPPPISLLDIGTYLNENGFGADILDTHIEEDYKDLIISKIKENDYLFVGITTIIGKFLKNTNEIIDLIRKVSPKIPIVLGGIMASISPEDCLRRYGADYIVRFEGEETCLELARALENNLGVESINGISYFKNDEIVNNPPRIPKLTLDDYPIPKWELFGDYFNNRQVPYYFLIMSSRGCPFNCKFCYKHSIDKEIRSKVPAWRFRSAGHIIKEIEYMHKKTGSRVFTFGDDNFFVNKKRAIEILDYFRKNEFYIEECIGPLNCIDNELIKAMAGIVQTFIFSIETASQRLQKYINKQLDLESIPTKVQQLHENGIVCNTSFIIGLPTERDEDLRKNIDLMLKIKEISPFARGNSYLFLPLPKTHLYYSVEDIYNVKLPCDLEDLEQANFWVKEINDPVGKKFRPWLSDEKFKFLVHYGIVFNEVFKSNNSKQDGAARELLDKNLEIRDMFKGVEIVNHPKTDYVPYVLDKVLKREPVDLANDLKNK